MRPLATSTAPTTNPVSMSNKFHGLPLEEPLLPEENPQFYDDPSEVHVAGGLETSTASGAKDHELLRLNGKINVCQAHMLLDSGSTYAISFLLNLCEDTRFPRNLGRKHSRSPWRVAHPQSINIK